MSRPNQFLSPEGDIEEYFVTEYWLIDQWVGDTLWNWGYHGQSNLGINLSAAVAGNAKSTPVTTFAGGTNWKQSSCNISGVAAIKTDGTLWVWGSNGNSALGNFSTTGVLTPVTTFAGGNNWKQVSGSGYVSAAIKTDGTLWAWGQGSTGVGQLGNNANGDRCTPVTTFAGGTNWKQVSSAGQQMAAIKTDGTLWTWGNNGGGKLGVNDTTNRLTPVTTFAGGTNWKQVSCGDAHMAAVKTDGTLWAWGFNTSGQLGINTTTQRNTPVTTFAGGTNWKQVACGVGQHVAAIKTDGTLWTWGTNGQGQLGNNTAGISRSTPITTFAGGTNWKQASIAGSSTFATKTDGTLWCWGRSDQGILGNNQASDSITSTPVTTFAGGTNWKQVVVGEVIASAITSGTDPTYFIS